jgi:ABC-type branched-subunit amino acid transport system permease subunit
MCLGRAGGVLFAHFMRFITPRFSFIISITIVSMMVVGDQDHQGPILGALIMAALPELLRPLAN